MIFFKSEREIEKIRTASKIVGEILNELGTNIRPGVTTRELDLQAEALMTRKKVKSAFKGYRGYPTVLCTSVNESVVHEIPSDRVLREGDIIGIDCGVIWDGFYGDAAKTYGVGTIDAESQRLLEVTRDSLYKGIQEMKTGNYLHDISWAVQSAVESAGYSVVRDFVGHGIGRSLHEEPQVPNFGKPRTGLKLGPGLVLAIEPMVNVGGPEVIILEDGWTAVAKDGRRSAHFEHTVALTNKGCEILSQI